MASLNSISSEPKDHTLISYHKTAKKARISLRLLRQSMPRQYVGRKMCARPPPTKNVGADPCVRPAVTNTKTQQARRVLRRTVKSRRRSYGQQNVGGDAHIAPPISFPQIFRYVAGRIISAPTFTHTFCKRPGRRGRRPLQFVSADVVKSAGRPRAASPTIHSGI